MESENIKLSIKRPKQQIKSLLGKIFVFHFLNMIWNSIRYYVTWYLTRNDIDSTNKNIIAILNTIQLCTTFKKFTRPKALIYKK